MLVDLIAQTCKGSDSLKIHALQRMLDNYEISAWMPPAMTSTQIRITFSSKTHRLISMPPTLT